MAHRQRALITGGAGFLGSQLCERLLERGYAVSCVDNFYTGRKENLEICTRSPHFTLIEHDICTPLDVEVDLIYNLACPASPVHYQSNPVQTIKTNVYGTMHMLDLAHKLGIPFLQASTSEVYGDPLMHPQKEEYWGHVNPIGVRSCYDEGKRCAETLCFDYYRQYGVEVRVVRIFNTFGPRMDPHDGRVVSNFIVQALSGQPLTIYGDGSHTRSFCYVDDLIEAMMRVMDRKVRGPINIGNPCEFSIRELAEKVIALTQSTSSIEYRPLPSDDPKQRKPDIAKAKELLDWEPTIPLDTGLKHTIRYFQKAKQSR